MDFSIEIHPEDGFLVGEIRFRHKDVSLSVSGVFDFGHD